MATPAPETVTRYLRRLDQASLAALVSDCYRARDWDVTVEDGLVVARRDTATRVVAPVASGRIRDSTPADTSSRAIDDVVTPGTSERARRLAAAHDARLRDGTALAERLRYGLDREAAADICETHLGRSAAAMRPPLADRVRTALEGKRRRVAAMSSPAVAAMSSPAVAVVVVGVLVASLAVIGGPVTGSDGGSTTTTATIPTATTNADSTVPNPAAAAETTSAFLADGTLHVQALAAVHERTLETSSYHHSAVIVTHDGNSTHVQRVEFTGNGSRYLLRTQSMQCGGPATVAEYYFDGQEVHQIQYSGGNMTYEVYDPSNRARRLRSSARWTIVERYLTTNATAIVGTDDSRETVVVGTGRPGTLPLPTVRNYTVAARVSERGFVRSLRVTFDRGNADDWTAIGHRYTDVGSAAVFGPTWADAPRYNAGDPSSTFVERAYSAEGDFRRFCGNVPTDPDAALWRLFADAE